MVYLDIVLNVPLKQSFSYTAPEALEPAVGKRAEVHFGNRRMPGYIVGVHDTLPPTCPVKPEQIKTVEKILDKEPIFTPELLGLARWMSEYYLCTLGEAISTMLPSGRRETDAGGFSFVDEMSGTKQPVLSGEQSQAVQGIISSSGFHYLYGKTGSGKTEVFLQAAEHMLSSGKGVIYLVPEIGLTSQVIQAVVSRFGNTAAVIHSGLTPSQRLKEWKRILTKEARVVVGARSAVFAPVPDLGLIIIDEEHDASYKSGTTPRYHARQVAMHRCSTTNIPLVMGSATPSIEAWYLMQQGTIKRYTLTRRLAGGAMPRIICVNLSQTNTKGGCISPALEHEIRQTLGQKKQVILFLNRRGFTHFFRCQSCGYELMCKNCSVPMTYHRNENRLRCHYCGWSTEVPRVCPNCASLDVGYAGFGTEFIESEINAKFPAARTIRIDTDSLTKKGELQEKLADFEQGKYDIMLGTQMVAKGLNFKNLQLVGVVSADTGLHMPDFRSAERTFALITQVAGRAGRFFPDGKVIVQSYNPERAPVAYACSGDLPAFYEDELVQRRMLGFPPFSRMVRLVFRAPDRQAAEHAAEDAAYILKESALDIERSRKNILIEVLGPSECPIEKIAMNHRQQILLRSGSISALQRICRHLLDDFKQPQDVYIEVDVDPVSTL